MGGYTYLVSYTWYTSWCMLVKLVVWSHPSIAKLLTKLSAVVFHFIQQYVPVTTITIVLEREKVPAVF